MAIRYTGLSWGNIETTNNNYNWTDLDNKIFIPQQENKDVISVLLPGRKVTSNWPPLKSCSQPAVACPLENTDLAKAEWEDFLKKVFERYDYDGIDDMPGLTKAFKNWQIGNEFESSAQFGGTKEEYVTLLKEAEDAKNASSPTPTIILSGLTHPEKLGRCYSNGTGCSDLTVIWQKYVLENAKNGSDYYYDVIDLHIFNWFYYQPNIIKDAVNGIKLTPSGKTLVSYEWTAAFGMFDHSNETEWQMTINRPLNGDCNYDGVLDPSCKEGDATYDLAQSNFEAVQAEDFVRVFTSLIGQGLAANGLIYVQFADWHATWCYSPSWNYQGLLRRAIPTNVCNNNYGGPGTFIAKKPAYYNYQTMMEYLDNYQSVAEIFPCSGSNCFSYKFEVGGDTRIVIWSASTSTVQDVDLAAHFTTSEVCYYKMVTQLDGSLNPIVPASLTYPRNAVDVELTPAMIFKKQVGQNCPAL